MNRLVINANNKRSKISPEIYGHFSEHLGRCIYGGLFVGENSEIPNTKGMRNDVVSALKNIKIPVLRWPGGCFADEYHWKDGIGPRESRKRMINTHWGGVVEDNSFGTHEFMELCSQLECEPYINGNLGSGTVQEMSEWVEYITFNGVSPMADLRKQNGREEPWKMKYFAVGNENWGCGGNMRPEYYADLYRRYQTYVRNYSGNWVYRVACGPNSADYNWTEVLMKNAADYMDGLSLHYYTVPNSWQKKGSATEFTEAEYYETLKKTLFMSDLIKNHSCIMDKYDPGKRIGLIVDEWGTWYDVEEGTNPGFLYQQNTMRDAVLAAINFNVFNTNCDRVKMANIAQTVNVLQAVILTEGGKMVLTPTYHVFDLYKNHHNSYLLDSFVDCNDIVSEKNSLPTLHSSVSIDESGVIHATIANLSATEKQDIEGEISNKAINDIKARVLNGEMKAHNNFDSTENVTIKPLENISFKGNSFSLTLPACSVTEITIS